MNTIQVFSEDEHSKQEPPSSEQAAYIAGILDGEGSIGVSMRTGKKSGRRGYCFRATVSVSNTNYQLLNWLKTTTNLGSISNKNIPKKEESKAKERNWKQRWVWSAWSQQAKKLIELARPYLVIKDKQADLLLKFMEGTKIARGRKGLSDEEWAFQEHVYWELKLINQRGLGVESIVKSQLVIKSPFISEFLKERI